MAAYDNLLANVPTDLWIGGKWRKASDGGRFDVIEHVASLDQAPGALMAGNLLDAPYTEAKVGRRVEVTFAEPIRLTRGVDAGTFENERLNLENLMVQGTDDA